MVTSGFIQAVPVRAGQIVEEGQVILIADDPELRSRHRQRRAQLQELQLAYRQALSEDPVRLQEERAKIDAVKEEIEEIERRVDDLVIRSPQAGVLIIEPTSRLVGRFAQRGQVLGRVADLGSLRVTSLVDQFENAVLFDQQNPVEKIELRAAGRLDRALDSRLLKRFPSGRLDLPHPALGFAGGGSIATDPSDPEGVQMLQPHFELWLEFPHQVAVGAAPATWDYAAPRHQHVWARPGQRVYVRFTLEKRRPWLWQWVRRLRQLFRERASV